MAFQGGVGEGGGRKHIIAMITRRALGGIREIETSILAQFLQADLPLNKLAHDKQS